MEEKKLRKVDSPEQLNQYIRLSNLALKEGKE